MCVPVCTCFNPLPSNRAFHHRWHGSAWILYTNLIALAVALVGSVKNYKTAKLQEASDGDFWLLTCLVPTKSSPDRSSLTKGGIIIIAIVSYCFPNKDVQTGTKIEERKKICLEILRFETKSFARRSKIGKDVKSQIANVCFVRTGLPATNSISQHGNARYHCTP